MRLAMVLTGAGAAAMGAVLLYAFTQGDFAAEGAQLLSMPWGIVSLVDLYVGFILFSGWIIYREKSLVRAIGWVLFVMVLGFFTASLYAFLALRAAGGDWRRFWMGKHAA
jgi:membrane-anchored protein YejM (alkaline phosphatase superfamily)